MATKEQVLDKLVADANAQEQAAEEAAARLAAFKQDAKQQYRGSEQRESGWRTEREAQFAEYQQLSPRVEELGNSIAGLNYAIRNEHAQRMLLLANLVDEAGYPRSVLAELLAELAAEGVS